LNMDNRARRSPSNENPIRRGLSYRWDSQQLLMNKTPRRRRTHEREIVESRLATLTDHITDSVDSQRPHGVSGSTPSTLQLARLIQTANKR
jgi:hypothetical protein